MPQVSRFFGIIISMYYDDHNPPHFHVKYGEFSAKIKIKDFTVINGFLPSRALGLVMEWAAIHQIELMANWNMAITNKNLKQIEPLR